MKAETAHFAGTFTLLPNAQTVSTQQADGIGQDSAAELEPVKPGKVQHNLGYVPNVGSKISEPQPRMAPTGMPSAEVSSPRSSKHKCGLNAASVLFFVHHPQS